MQANWQINEHKNWFAKLGTEARLFIQNEIFSGLNGNFPDSFTTNNGYIIRLKNLRRNAIDGANYLERIGISFQASVGHHFYKNKKSNFSIIACLSPTIYVSAQNEEIIRGGWAYKNNNY